MACMRGMFVQVLPFLLAWVTPALAGEATAALGEEVCVGDARSGEVSEDDGSSMLQAKKAAETSWTRLVGYNCYPGNGATISAGPAHTPAGVAQCQALYSSYDAIVMDGAQTACWGIRGVEVGRCLTSSPYDTWVRGASSLDPAPHPHPSPPAPAPEPAAECSACLCVFDIDRTLTGKQSDTTHCPRNRVLSFYDAGYGGGKATLSALAATGIAATPCNECYLGITSAGDGSGEHSEWNRYVLDSIMRSQRQDAFVAAHPSSKHWSFGTDVHSPYVLRQSNRMKQNSVELIRQWYGAQQRGVCIKPERVFFFGDRTENIEPFRQQGLNSREISCGSRDQHLHHGGVGYCGATPEEVKLERGNIVCRDHELEK